MTLQDETQYDTVTFSHFGRSWKVPAKRHLSHITQMTMALRSGVSDYNALVCEVMLGQEQFIELLKVNPDEDQLNDFVNDIAKAMGLGSQGNSGPSSTSS